MAEIMEAHLPNAGALQQPEEPKLYRRWAMKSFVQLVATALLLPIQAHASTIPSVPEALSMALLGIGLAGLGAAEVVRRRKNK